MKANEIDAQIAVHVFGAKKLIRSAFHKDNPVVTCQFTDSSPIGFSHLPKFSTSMAEAWSIVDKINEEFDFRLFGPHRRMYDEDWDKWECELTRKDTRAWWSARADEAPMSICLAALKAFGVNDE